MRKSFTTQPALFTTHDLLDHPALGALDGIESLINWPALELLLPKGKGETGRSGYAAMTLFRALLLGLWYDLSDVKLEAQLARDLMFRKFCRRSSINIYHRSVPDHIGQISASGGCFRRAKQPAFQPECRPLGGPYRNCRCHRNRGFSNSYSQA